MNIVYGFGGMRSDGDKLVFQPTIPARWDGYSFPILFQGSKLVVKVDKKSAFIKAVSGEAVEITVYGREYKIDSDGVEINLEKVG